MKKVLINIILLFTFSISGMAQIEYGKTVEISKEVLLDKIKGGWAGQTIGCTYGGPTEFKYRGAMGLCGEKAYQSARQHNAGNSTFRNYLIDEIYKLDGDALEKGAKYEIR